MHPALLALLICVASAALESALAGRGLRARFAELRQPPFSPPLTLWFVIGAACYVICYVILYRLLATGLPEKAHRAAVALLLGVMAVNAAWGWFFFKRKDLRASFVGFLPYLLVALALALVLVQIDRTSLAVLTPYLMYLAYAVWWSYGVWVLNRPPAAAAANRELP